ncbi:MAG: TrkH family potassium uptake protein [Kosmotogaceae bacterium]
MYLITMKERYRIILGYIGQLFTYFPIIIMLPVMLFFWYSENQFSEMLPFIYTALIVLVFGLAFRMTFKVKPGTPLTVQEGAIIVVLVWVFGIFFSSLPFYLGDILPFSQSVFESTSGWTTTGLTMVNEDAIPKIYLVWRSILQFMGGAGFAIIMMSAIAGPGGFGLYHAEGRMDNLVPNVRSSVRRILVIYFGYALGGFIAYTWVGMNTFDAFNHSLTALATGGFSTHSSSIGGFNSISIEIVTIVLMFLGTTGFGIHYTLWKGNFRAFWKNGEPKLMGLTVIVFTPLLLITTFSLIFTGVGEAFRHALFQGVSALTGTGFSTVDVSWWSSKGYHTGLYLLTLLMIFGGDMDSTSGGLKQFRLFAIIKIIFLEIKRFFLPRNAVVETEIWKGEKKQYIKPSLVKEILIIFTLYFVTFGIGTGILASYGHSLADASFEFASALSTVGLSVGITGPDAPLGLIWTETAGMFLGRLEFLVIIFGITKLIKDVRFATKKQSRGDKS